MIQNKTKCDEVNNVLRFRGKKKLVAVKNKS